MNISEKAKAFHNELKNLSVFERKINDIFMSEFEEKLPEILNKNESLFLEELTKKIHLILEDKFESSCLSNPVLQNLLKTHEINFMKNFINPILKQLLSEINSYKANQSNDNLLLTEFRKHCRFTKFQGIHPNCGESNFLQVKDKNNSYLICLTCNMPYYSSAVLLFCQFCNMEYYSCLQKKKKSSSNKELATWEKYHCSAMVNDYLHCINCANGKLYLDLDINILICDSCQFSGEPTSIYWKCYICKEEFICNAKIYNPLEHRLLKAAINNAILYKEPATPSNPCCPLRKNFPFIHKKECTGKIYLGEYNKNKIIVCEKCRMMNFYDNFIWTCPICRKRFEGSHDDSFTTLKFDFESVSLTEIKDTKETKEVITKKAQSEILFNKKAEQKNENILTMLKPEKKCYQIKNRFVSSNTINQRTSQLNNKVKDTSSPIKSSLPKGKGGVNSLKIPKGNLKISPIKAEKTDKDKKENTKNTKDTSITSNNNEGTYDIFSSDSLKKNNFNNNSNINYEISPINFNPHRSCVSRNHQSRNRGDRSNDLVTFNFSTCYEQRPAIKGIREIREVQTRESLEMISNPSSPQMILTENPNEELEYEKIKEFKIDDFTKIKQIGEGTFAKIYLVENIKTNVHYCLKKLIANNEIEVKKLSQEYELMHYYKHSNILEILGINISKVDMTTYIIYILTEIADHDWGKEIKERANKKKYYEEEELITILKYLADCMLFLQKKSISHRDIKPQNILKFNDTFKLADFGEAKKINDIKRKMSTIRGTEHYMSPQLFNGLTNNLKNVIHNSYKSDVYSLGLCFFYAASLNHSILIGIRECFEEKDVNKILRKYLNDRYSEKFISLLEKMLSIDEDLRLDFLDLNDSIKNLYSK